MVAQKVEFDPASGMLTVAVTDADLGELLGKIAEKSAVTIGVGAGVTKKVSVSFSGLPLEQGVNAILSAVGEGNLAAEYTKQPGSAAGSFRLEKIVVLRKGSADTPATAKSGGGVPEKDAGALDRLLRQYGDPKTTRDEKLTLRRSIRRAAKTPEEKAQLKRAVLDPRNRGAIAEELQIALVQSMMSHPENSDKAYVLDLLRRESSPGTLVRAMVGSGDPTYVNYLMSAARERDLHAIGVIGSLRVKQAVPVLQQLAAAPDNGSPARQAAATALRRMGAAPADRAGSGQVREERLKR